VTTETPLVAGVELGGTKCVCVLASGPDRIEAEHRIPTTDPATTMDAVEAVLDDWRAGPGFAALGIGSFGPLELNPRAMSFGHVTETPKPGWRNADVAPRLIERYGLPTRIDTDVVGAALAEARWGGARGLSTYCYITVGTGVGAGIVVNGRPVMGLGHPEAGHVKVPRLDGDDWGGACPYHGDCVEGLAAGSAIERRTGRKAETIPADDPVWRTVAYAMAGLCHNLVMTVPPERILLGGSVMTGQPQLLPMIRRMLAVNLGGYGEAARISKMLGDYVALPALGNQAGPLGSIALGLDALAAA
jgi:fructokinase